jgi:hypothetical protein
LESHLIVVQSTLRILDLDADDLAGRREHAKNVGRTRGAEGVETAVIGLESARVVAQGDSEKLR